VVRLRESSPGCFLVFAYFIHIWILDTTYMSPDLGVPKDDFLNIALIWQLADYLEYPALCN
jgi:hypothetical protein